MQETEAKVGRPTDIAKTRAILEASFELFLSRGLAGTTVEAIAVKAGVAKTTIYARYEDRETIFAAVIEYLTEPLNDILQPVNDLSDLEEVLHEQGFKFARNFEHQRISQFEPVILLHAMERPKIARSYFEHGFGRLRSYIAEIVTHHLSAGTLNVIDAADTAETMAEDLLMLWRGNSSVETRLKHNRPPTDAEIMSRIERGTIRFLKLYGSKA